MKPFLPECHSFTGNSADPICVLSASPVPSSIRRYLYHIGTFLVIASGLVFASLLTTNGQECTLPSRIFLPETDLARYDGYGQDVDVDNNYMVAGAPSNDSLQVNAGFAYVYKLGADNKWIKIAELFASDAAKSNGFGAGVSISGNSIAVYARDGFQTPMFFCHTCCNVKGAGR